MALTERTPLDGTVTQLAVGTGSATGDSAIALGDNASASDANAVVVGPRSRAMGNTSSVGSDVFPAATQTERSCGFGAYAGRRLATGVDATLLGQSAGSWATNADRATFVGSRVGSLSAFANDPDNSPSGTPYLSEIGTAVPGRVLVVGDSKSGVFVGYGAGAAFGARNAQVTWSSTTSNESVAVGALAAAGSYAAATGAGSTANEYSVAVGYNATAWAPGSVALGRNAFVDDLNNNSKAVAIGQGSQALHTYSVALGGDVTTTAINQVMVRASPTVQSSIRFKERVTTVTPEVADKVLNLRPVHFVYKNPVEDTTQHVGIIAEEAAEHMPLSVSRLDDGTVQGFTYTDIGVYLADVVRRQRDTINDLLNTVSDLTARVAALEAR